MGILNITDDSFFSGSRLTTEVGLLKRAEQHIIDGATFLDIGAMSSRPGATIIDEKEERKRVQKAVSKVKKEFPSICLSADTFRSTVAQSAIDHGVEIINDISGFSFDEHLLDVVASHKIAYILMHVEGTFLSMHNRNNALTHDSLSDELPIVERLCSYFTKKLTVLRQKNIENIVLDPGFGFSKTFVENYALLDNLSQIHAFHCPILVGVSRKSMIYRALKTTPEQALNGTTVLNTFAITKGANILRVHDVKECKEAIDLLSLMKQHRNITL